MSISPKVLSTKTNHDDEADAGVQWKSRLPGVPTAGGGRGRR